MRNILKFIGDFITNYSNWFESLNNMEQKKPSVPLPDYERAIKLDPNDALAYNNLGVAYDEQKKYAEAISSYKEAIKIYPEYALARNNLLLAKRELKKSRSK